LNDVGHATGSLNRGLVEFFGVAGGVFDRDLLDECHLIPSKNGKLSANKRYSAKQKCHATPRFDILRHAGQLDTTQIQ
jgi:hypothetical protein